MGQYWLVSCPSEKEHTECLFAMKLGEMLFSFWPGFLVPLLLRKSSDFSIRSSSCNRPLLSPRDPWVGRWAGEPILCIGDYLKPGDLPIMEQHGDLGIDTSLSLHLAAKDSYNDISDLPQSWCSITKSTKPCGRVLRNLTTKEYVRESGLAGGPVKRNPFQYGMARSEYHSRVLGSRKSRRSLTSAFRSMALSATVAIILGGSSAN
ncbi:uncharacterized protein BDV14DRAFT_23900 [Aspergillus stella-maris]|uniref:uncharacterized protein n=1 Tax=Aspergillus stella-maris TaxID=1810926 RepID=UPI003CCE1F40